RLHCFGKAARVEPGAHLTYIGQIAAFIAGKLERSERCLAVTPAPGITDDYAILAAMRLDLEPGRVPLARRVETPFRFGDYAFESHLRGSLIKGFALRKSFAQPVDGVFSNEVLQPIAPPL